MPSLCTLILARAPCSNRFCSLAQHRGRQNQPGNQLAWLASTDTDLWPQCSGPKPDQLLG